MCLDLKVVDENRDGRIVFESQPQRVKDSSFARLQLRGTAPLAFCDCRAFDSHGGLQNDGGFYSTNRGYVKLKIHVVWKSLGRSFGQLSFNRYHEVVINSSWVCPKNPIEGQTKFLTEPLSNTEVDHSIAHFVIRPALYVADPNSLAKFLLGQP